MSEVKTIGTTSVTAKSLYEELTTGRSTGLAVARRCAELTIPSLLPPEGHSSASAPLPTPYQSLGAYGVNNLTAKVMLALYPAGQTFFRYMLPESLAAEKKGLPQEQQEDIDRKLAAAENEVIRQFEGSSIRPKKAEAFMHLIVAGNVLVRYESLKEFRIYRLDQYVCRRGADGKPLDVVVKEGVSVRGLDEEVRTACKITSKDKSVDVYTHVKWEDGKVYWHQEINALRVPDSEGNAPEDVSPWQPLRWKAVPGADYGRGHCEEYLGDLISLEGLSQSLVEFAAVASKVVILVSPGTQTSVRDINAARSGQAVTGRLEDVNFLQMDKFNDFRVVESVVERLERRLSQAFLLQTGVVRDAERVTAEEFRRTAQELEDTLGSTYTNLTDEEQLPFIRRTLKVVAATGAIPALPKGTAEPVVVTGFQAIGRNHELNKLRGAVQDTVALLGPEQTMSLLNGSNILQRIFLGWGVSKVGEVVKTPEVVAQEQAQQQQMAMMQTLLEKGTGPAISSGNLPME